MATITLGPNTYTLVALPSLGFSELTISFFDAVAVVGSPYVPSQAQTQTWPGADGWGAQIALPKQCAADGAKWRAFLAGLRGMQNVFQLSDPLHPNPAGVAKGAPLVDGTIGGGNAVTAVTLNTRGWLASTYRQLLPGDYLQIGYRLHMVVAEVDSDSAGKAQISIYPSLRETPADGTAITLVNCKGVFRLSGNKRQWHATADKLIQTGFSCTEAR